MYRIKKSILKKFCKKSNYKVITKNIPFKKIGEFFFFFLIIKKPCFKKLLIHLQRKPQRIYNKDC